MSLEASELILNPDGSIYHLAIRREHVAPTIILVGDPSRVCRVSRHFDELEANIEKREFHTHVGRIGSKRFSVISTGIGTDNIDIVLNELDALVNIDPDNRRLRPQLQSLDLVRFGTSGSLQLDIPVDSFVLSSWGLGLDALMHWYGSIPVSDTLLQQALQEQFTDFPIKPYLIKGSAELEALFPQNYHRGITATCSGFYAPQGRQLRLVPRVKDLADRLTAFRSGPHLISNFEMETAGIYGLAALMGHRALSASAILANRPAGTFSSDPYATIDRLIEKSLEILSDS